MNKKYILALCAVAALILAACNKDPLKSLTGSYTYKISGILRVTDTSSVNPAEGSVRDTVDVNLAVEQGQMHIVPDGDGVIVTFNDILGSVDVAHGSLDGDVISVEGTFPKQISTTSGFIASGNVEYVGKGFKRDGTIILNLDYRGSLSSPGSTMPIIGSNVNCVAQEN